MTDEYSRRRLAYRRAYRTGRTRGYREGLRRGYKVGLELARLGRKETDALIETPSYEGTKRTLN